MRKMLDKEYQNDISDTTLTIIVAWNGKRLSTVEKTVSALLDVITICWLVGEISDYFFIF